MIRLSKGRIPTVLERNAGQWTAVIVEKLAKNEPVTQTERSRYNHPEIKAALLTETYNKCAYCESKLRHVAYGDIEHIVPKSLSPELWFQWENLTIACDRCNTNKSNFNGDHFDFIDPYEVDPEDHFWFCGSLLFPRPGDDGAAITERTLDLNRAELVERRTERLQGLMRQIDVLERVRDKPTLHRILVQDFMREISEDKEYAAMAREVARKARSILEGEERQ